MVSKRFRRWHGRIWSIVLPLLLMPGAAARGDDEPSPPPRYPVADTVDVAGRRLPFDPLSVPVAVSRVQAETFEDNRRAGLDEALAYIPGVLAQSRAGATDVRITLRGFGARGVGERSNAGTTRGIRILVDGFPITEPDGRTSLDLADLGAVDHIDVVRSNASALFGSASGGLINIVTRAGFVRPFREASFTTGSFGFLRAEARAGFMAGGARISAGLSNTQFDGWRDHSESGVTSLQAAILTDPSPQSSLAVLLYGTRNRYDQPGALTEEEYEADPRLADPTFVERDNRRDNRLGRLGVRWQHDQKNGDILLLSGFVEPKIIARSERGRYRDFHRVHTGGTGLYSGTFAMGESTVARWTGGLDEAYQDGSVLFYGLTPEGDRDTSLVANTREGINTLGFFGELAVDPGTRWSLTAGARYDLIHYIFEDHMAPDLDETRTLNHVSPRLAVSWLIQPDHSLYGALSGGIEAPAFNEVDPPPPFDATDGLNPFLEPATSLTYEVGLKGFLMRDAGGAARLNYDAALYWIELENDIIPYDGGAYYLMAGRSRRRGVELGLSGDSGRGAAGERRHRLDGNVALTYSDNEYLEYVNDLGDFGGNEAAGIPSFVGNARLRHRWPFGAGLEGRVQHTGSYFADDGNTARVSPATVFHLIASLEHPSLGGSSLFLGVNNVTDEKYVSSVFINGVGGRYYEPGMERNLVFGITVGTGGDVD